MYSFRRESAAVVLVEQRVFLDRIYLQFPLKPLDLGGRIKEWIEIEPELRMPRIDNLAIEWKRWLKS